MKRFVLALVVGLMFIIGLSSDAFSRAQPFDFRSPCIDPDDHTWGGEQEGGSPSLGRKPEDPSAIWVSGFKSLNVFFNGIVARWWWPENTDTGAASESTDYSVPIHHNNEAKNLEANSNHKGN